MEKLYWKSIVANVTNVFLILLWNFELYYKYKRFYSTMSNIGKNYIKMNSIMQAYFCKNKNTK